MTRVLVCIAILTTFFSLKSFAQLASIKYTDSLPAIRSITVLPQNFYNQHKGYACKKEDQLQRATGLNVFIRLGSKNYADYLEGKPNTIKP